MIEVWLDGISHSNHFVIRRNVWKLSTDPLLILNVLFRIRQSFALLLCSAVWVEHGCHSSGFSRGIWLHFVKIWLAEAARIIAGPVTCVHSPRVLILFTNKWLFSCFRVDSVFPGPGVSGSRGHRGGLDTRPPHGWPVWRNHGHLLHCPRSVLCVFACACARFLHN